MLIWLNLTLNHGVKFANGTDDQSQNRLDYMDYSTYTNTTVAMATGSGTLCPIMVTDVGGQLKGTGSDIHTLPGHGGITTFSVRIGVNAFANNCADSGTLLCSSPPRRSSACWAPQARPRTGPR